MLSSDGANQQPCIIFNLLLQLAPVNHPLALETPRGPLEARGWLRYSIGSTAAAAEYGLKSLAPFLGRDFTGQGGVADYFRLVTDILTVHAMTFEKESSWMVDTDLHMVELRGKGCFSWKDTGKVCEEEFFYRIQLAQEECHTAQQGQWKVQDYRVWSDTGAAYLAHIHQLGKMYNP
ncbi:hypothetical protein N7478_001422 [Penicillium angulare]|uniref:uncharacterized protein n=1 Tax=Penicillium angulare TaxID=116970 RepID=UPI0025416873|nr:uncharacterized protein N7478_001422 [Penicillium angulare]KAJ5292171.1 hypothetical protein N7478_001422 [Penicillium angulare]